MVKDKIRKTGISLLGDVPWGMHFCLFYHTKRDLFDILVPYFKTGLENNEFCMWVTSEPLKVKDAKRALEKVVKNLDECIEKGQIEIVDYSQWYTKSGKFEPDKVLQGWVEKENQALKKGFDGLRLTGNTFWLEKENWKIFADYEATVDNVIGEHRMVAICSYSLDKCGASEIIDVASSHGLALIRREGKWETIGSSKRKCIEDALQQSNSRLKLQIDRMPIGCIVWNSEFRVVTWNPAAEKIFGFSAGEALGNHPYDIIVPKDTQPHVNTIWSRLLKGDNTAHSLNENISKDGRIIICEWSNTPLKEVDGTVIGVLSMVQDVTESKQAEEALRESEGKFSAMLESIADHMSMMDKDLNIIWTNETAKRIFGNDIIGKKCYEVYHKRKEPCKPYPCLTLKAFQDGKIHEHETQVMDKNGKILYFHCTANVALRDKNGKPSAVIEVSRDITERKLTGAKLQQSEARFRTMFDAAADGLFLSNLAATKYLLANKACLQMLGYTLEEFRELELADLHPPEDLPFVRAEIAKFIQARMGRRAEVRFLRKDRSVFLAEVNQTSMTFEDQDYTLIAFRDISERKKIEEILRQSEERYRSLVETTDTGYVIIDPVGNVLDANQEYVRLSGHRDLNEICGRSIIEWTADYEKEKNAKAVEKCAKEGYIRNLEIDYVDIHGKVTPIEINATVVKIDGIPRILSLCRDITKRRQAEQALRESEERYRALTEFANDCIAVSHGGKTVYRNRAYERLIGYSVEETSGRLSIDTVVPEDRERVREYHKRRLEGKDAPELYEADILTKDGRRITLEIKDSLIEYQGHPAIMAVARDVTERKRAEAEKRQLEKQLFQLQKMQAIGTFASGISHDFNNIIVAIIANAEMALDDLPEDALARRELERILKAGSRAKDLVKQILAFSRKGQKELKPFRIGEVVKEALKLLGASLSESIEVRQDIATESDMVLGDPTEIYQVLMNLCTNAADAMHKKGGVLKVNLTDVNFTSDELPSPDMKPGSYFRITVSDTGHGISRASMELIFDLGYTTKDKGRGMGLNVVQKIIKGYGGAITVDSEVGRCTTFQVFFPKVDIGTIPEESPVGPLPVGKEKILFVDDEKDIVDIIPRLLQRLGYNVVAKTNSLEALEIFHSQPDKFDLIITDQTMPHMTGAELAKRAFKIRPNIPIILYTGFSNRTTLKKARAMGIRDVLFKPISIRDMAETIRKVLNGDYGKYSDY